MTTRSRILAVLAWGSAIALVALAGAGCNNDPIPQGKLDALPADSASPGPLHRPGEACLLCHSAYVGATPELALGGTVYKIDPMTAGIAPAPTVLVTITDSTGDTRSACTNAAGNFFIKKEDWDQLTYPLKIKAGQRRMNSIVGRDGSCATCHQLPTADRPGTGAGRDSAGVVLVDDGDVDVTCGGVP